MSEKHEEDDETEENIELEEVSLEELTEQPEQQAGDNFSEFMVSSSEAMPTATLNSSPSDELALPTETLEEETADAPQLPAVPEIEPEEEQYTTVYNEPQYTAGTSEESILSRREERGMIGTPEELRHIQPRVEIEDWQEGGQSIEGGRTGGGHLREYVVSDEVEKREERRLPFEEKTKYRSSRR